MGTEARGTGGKWALEKSGSRAYKLLGHIKLPILPQMPVCSSAHPFQCLSPPAPICPKYPFSFGVDLPLYLFYPSAHLARCPFPLSAFWFYTYGPIQSYIRSHLIQ